MATFIPADYPRCPHEVATKASLIDAHAWCRDESRVGIYALYAPSRADYDPKRGTFTVFMFCFSDPNMALEFKMAFG